MIFDKPIGIGAEQVMRRTNILIDSHVHLDMIARLHPERINWLKDNQVGVVSWSYFEDVQSLSQLEDCLASKARIIHELAAGGLDCWFLAGIHPRSIPPDLQPEQIPSLLEPFLADLRCRGIGEIGLETADANEQEILIAQLELGLRVIPSGMRIGIHTPRANKGPVTRTTLQILERFSSVSAAIVVDHCTPETIGTVLDAGFWAGVTLSSVKTSWEEMQVITQTCTDCHDRVMCNTDSGLEFFEDAVRCREDSVLPEAVRKAIFHDNAKRFFHLDPSG